MVEIQTPTPSNVEGFIEGISGLNGFDGVLLEECGGVSSVAIAEKLKERCDKAVIPKITCRDRNRIALHSQLATAAAAEIVNIVFSDGAHPIETAFATAKPVYEVDSLSLIRMLKNGEPAFGEGEDSPLASVDWKVGACIGGATSMDLARAKRFVASGVDFFFVSSVEVLKSLKNIIDKEIYVSRPAKEIDDFSKFVDEAQSAGADGINVVAEKLEAVLDGRFA